MARVETFVAPFRKGFVYETPDGSKKFTGYNLFRDPQVWGFKDDFDGREVVTSTFPAANGQLATEQNVYRGTTGSLYDVHAFTVDVAQRKVDVPSLLSAGFGSMAAVSGPRKGTDLLWLGEGRVYDVGKVDENGIGWISPVTARRIHKYSGIRDDDPSMVKQLAAGETVRFDQHEFGRPGNLFFEIDVFAPELTPRAGIQDRDEQKRILDTLGLTIDSDFFPPSLRNRPLSYVNNVGPEGNNVRLSYGLADSSVFQFGTPPSGNYQFRILKNGQEIRSFNLDWHRD